MSEVLQPFVDDGQKKGYKTGPVYYYKAKAGSVLADHAHDAAEILWVVKGSGKIQIEDKIDSFQAPCKIKTDAGVFHKFMPETDVNFIELRQPGNK